MNNEKFQNKYRIKSARATWHDYNSGIYFITICTKNREYFFGKIKTGLMQLSEIGKYASENLQNITIHYPYAEIPLFVVMPNHIHAIVFIDGDKMPFICPNAYSGRDGARPVSTMDMTNNDKQTSINEKMQYIDSFKGWLSVMIGGFKSAVTKFAHENDIDFAWQTRFHDHIIRDQNELNCMADYIENNPQMWDSDCFYWVKE